MEFAKDRLRSLIERHPDFYPMYTVQGHWKHSGEAWTHWCDGFLPGMLWIVYGREAQSGADRGWWRHVEAAAVLLCVALVHGRALVRLRAQRDRRRAGSAGPRLS